MAGLITITGTPRVLANLKRSNSTIAAGVERGLKLAGVFLQAESQRIVPVDLGILKGTADTRNVGGSGFDADIVVHYGAGADYAVYVHENLQAKHKSGKQAKYLEQPARQKKNEIIRIIKKEAKI